MGELDQNSSTTPKLINSLSCLLQRVVESNDIHSLSIPHKMSIFYGLTPPTISIQRYLERIFMYANCSPSCYVVAYVYLDRFTQRQPLLLINSFNIHRLLITSVLVAAKFMDDMYYNNAYYAKIGGISNKEMNILEVDFLFGMGFHLNVTPNTFRTYCSYLQKEILMLQIPFNIVILDPNFNAPNSFLFNEDEATSHQGHQQLAV